MTQPTPPDSGRETRVIDVHGRSIVIRQLTGGQMMYVTREAKLLQETGVGTDRKMEGITGIFDVLESQIVQEDDRKYLIGLVAKGQVDVPDLLGFIREFAKDEAEEEKPKVRRGRRPAIK